MKYHTDLAALTKAIAGIAKASATHDTNTQRAAVDCLQHLNDHGDTGPINRLYNALGQGARHVAFQAWLANFAPNLKPNTNKDKEARKASPYTFVKGAKADIDGADASPWFSFKPSATPAEFFDLKAAVKALLRKASKNGTIAGGNIDTLKTLAGAVGIPESDVPIGLKLHGALASAEPAAL